MPGTGEPGEMKTTAMWGYCNLRHSEHSLYLGRVMEPLTCEWGTPRDTRGDIAAGPAAGTGGGGRKGALPDSASAPLWARVIPSYPRVSRAIPEYPGLSRAIPGYLGLSRGVPGHPGPGGARPGSRPRGREVGCLLWPAGRPLPAARLRPKIQQQLVLSVRCSEYDIDEIFFPGVLCVLSSLWNST